MIFRMPKDLWGPWTPRRWQAEALPILIAEYSKPKPDSCVVRAVPRSGKSKLIAQAAACCQLEKDEVIVVSAPTIFLVEQLMATFRERLDTDGYALGESNVGAYYSNSKDITSRVIIACTNSCPELADKLMASGRRCAFWIADECVPAGTMISVNGKNDLPIERLSIGDTVYGIDHSTGKMVSTTVKHVFINEYEGPLCVINGVVMTPNHPVWTEDGYKRADEVEKLDGFIGLAMVKNKPELEFMDSRERKNFGKIAVYNIETGTGNYFANGLLVHNCHRTKCATISTAHAILNPFASLGVSGTPYRSKESESLHLFDKLLVNYKPEEALKDGVVVPFRPVFWEGGEGDLDSVCLDLTALAKGPGLYNAISISDSEVFSMKCLDAGVSARPIHSQMSDGDRARRIEEWKNGEISALVHVSLLQEGVDFPWLRWICLRRPCGSRVRYVQELSRVLSSFTDPVTGEVKDEAVVYDPQGIIKNFKLDYKAVLAGDVEDEDIEEEGPRDEKQSEKKRRQFEQLIFEAMREIVNATAGKKPLSFTPLAAYLYELVTAFDMSGLIDRKIANKNWREKPVSQKQIETATKMLWAVNHKSVPKPHQKPLNILAQQVVKDMDRGMASDLLTIMMALANHKKWPDLKILDRSAAESMRSHNKRTADLVQKPITTPQIKLVKPTTMTKKKDAEPSLFDPFAEP